MHPPLNYCGETELMKKKVALAVGAVLVVGARAPVVVTEDDVKAMRPVLLGGRDDTRTSQINVSYPRGLLT